MKKFLLLALMVVVPSEGVTHWIYPHECCHDLDCGPIVNIYLLEDNSKFITIKLDDGTYRSATFSQQFDIRPALDNREHACISYDMKPVCLFLNGQI